MHATTSAVSSKQSVPQASMRAGEKAPRVHTKESANDTIYVKALLEASGFAKQCFYIEMAVCLMFYADQNSASVQAKKLLRPIYEKAGYDCASSTGEDYKTVHRRISAAADLYSHIGGKETIDDWVEDAKGQRRIHAIVDNLERQGLNSISAIQSKASQLKKTPKKAKVVVSEPAGPAAPMEAEKLSDEPSGKPDSADKILSAMVGEKVSSGSFGRRLVDQLPPERIIKTEHIFCAIPMDATADEVQKMALELLAFATKLAAVGVRQAA